MWLLDIESRKEIRLSGLPGNLKLADMAWSPDQRHIAFTNISSTSGVELWLVDVAAKMVKKISTQALNSVSGRGFSWLPDSKSLLVRLRPANQGAAPVANIIPQGPNSQDALPGGSQRQVRTLQVLLKNESDTQQFDHYTLVQMAIVEVSGKTRTIGVPERTFAVSASPDGKYLHTQVVGRLHSYIVAAN